MGTIWIRCPTTGKTVTPDIQTDAVSFEALPAFTLTLTCPSCGEIHPWTKMGGHLVDTPPRYSN
jgi:hypothetical protein